MSATSKTPNYDLPIFVGTDKPAWLVDWNGAMTAIDSDLATINAAAEGAKSSADGAVSSVSALQTSVTNIQNNLTALSGTVAEIGAWQSCMPVINESIPGYRSGYIYAQMSPTLKLLGIYGTISITPGTALPIGTELFTLTEGPATSSVRVLTNCCNIVTNTNTVYIPDLNYSTNKKVITISEVTTAQNAVSYRFQLMMSIASWS